jgi:hypothetical protein
MREHTCDIFQKHSHQPWIIHQNHQEQSQTNHRMPNKLIRRASILPRMRDGYDSIWVIVDRLTKVAHLIPVNTNYTGAKMAELYMSRIVCLHGVPKKIVSDRGT